MRSMTGIFKTFSCINSIRNNRQYSVILKTINKDSNITNINTVFKSSQRWLFWEKDRKGGYNTNEKVSIQEHLKNGYKELKQEVKLFASEVKELIETDPLLISRPETEKMSIEIERLDGDEKCKDCNELARDVNNLSQNSNEIPQNSTEIGWVCN